MEINYVLKMERFRTKTAQNLNETFSIQSKQERFLQKSRPCDII
jgi:hypothetical protein